MAKNVGCVGSRSITNEQREMCVFIGYALAKLDKNVLSGNSDGADFAFATGVNHINPSKLTLFLPNESHLKTHWHSDNRLIFNHELEWSEIAARNHPSYNYVKPYVQQLFNRNAGIVINSDLLIALPNSTSKDGGGTGHDIRIAIDIGKPYIDISKGETAQYLIKYLQSAM
jgi:hypothetical protein